MRRSLVAFALCLSALPALAKDAAPAEAPLHDGAFVKKSGELSRQMPELQYGKYRLRKGRFFKPFEKGSASGDTVELRGTRECCCTGLSRQAAGGDPPAPAPLAFAWDGKGKAAVVAPIYSEGGGSGFYHGLAVAYEDDKGATKTLLALGILGDRVAVKEFKELADGAFEVKYMAHGPDQAMADEPAVEKTRVFRVQGGQLMERHPDGILRAVPME